MFFEDFEEAKGREFISRRRTITQTDAVLFTSLTGIIDPVFTDEIFASEQLFGTRVVPGPMIMAYALGLTDELGSGAVVAALGIDNVRFTSPVYPEDTVHVRTGVTSARASASRAEVGIIVLAHQVLNQKSVAVQSFERTLMVLRRP
jgi:acyl dehydratase